MKQVNMKTKLILLVIGLLAAISGFIFIFFPARFESNEYKYLLNKSRSLNKIIAFSLSPAILFKDKEATIEIIKGIVGEDNIEFIIAENEDSSFEYIYNINNRIPHAVVHNRGDYIDKQKKLLLTTSDVFHQNKKIGKLHVGYSTEPIINEINNGRLIIALISGLIFLVGSISVLIITRVAFKPLTYLTEVIQRIHSGESNVRAKETTDEIGSFAAFFNSLMDKLDSSKNELTKMNSGLSDLVRERTINLEIEIEDKKKTEIQLIQARDEAEDMSRLKSNFLANMSHELRTPMIGILGYSEILAMEIKDENYLEMINRINKSGKRLLETLNLVLDLSMIESRNVKLSISWVNLTKETASIIELLEPAVQNKNIYMKLVKNASVFAYVDNHFYYQVMNNIVGNAIKFTNQGGVTLQLGSRRVEEKNYAEVIVSDTGIGISKKFHSMIFDEFRQVSEGLSRQFEGTGLGLTITRNLVNLMHGKIELESKKGMGTVFTILFPQFESNI